MAEDTQPPASEAPAAAAVAEVVVVPAEEEAAAVKEAVPSAPEPEEEEEAKKAEAVPSAPAPDEEEAKKAEAAAEGEKEESGIPQSASFKEESNVVAELEDPEKKALDELKQLVQAALANNEFTRPPPPPPPAPKEEEKEKPAEKAEETAAEEAPKEEQPSAEPPKAEEAAAEPPKAEEAAAEPPKAEEAAAEPPAKVEEEALKVETEEVELPKPEEPAPPAAAEPAVAVIAVAEEEAVVVDEDGAKTVEAIAETVVSVAAAAEVTPTPAPAEEQPAEEEEKAPPPTATPEEVFLWGVPLLGDEKSDTILLKFLRARDFKVKDALAMLKDAVIWRKEFGIDGLLEEDLELPELDKVVFMNGHDKEGHPVCYNVYGEFQDKELYQKVFSDEEKRKRFLRWRIQLLEKGIRQQLDFAPSGVCSMVQVTDLRNSPVLGKREFRQATKRALNLLQDNYPEFVAKKVFINVPWWYLAYNRMISTVFTPRTRSKFVFAGPSKSSETLFKYIAPEQVPVQYGGLSKDNDPDFTTSDAVTEVTIKPSTKHSVEIPVSETCLLVWELRVLGWDVNYGAEFVPSAEDGYTVIVQKSRRFAPTDEPFVKNSFKIGEPGKVVLTVDNTSSKKKKLLYRSKTKSATESI